jgi:hypothetical protein
MAVDPISVAIDDAGRLADAVEEVSNIIGTGTRAIVLVVNNHTANALERTSLSFAHGGFAIAAPDRIEPHTSSVFGAISTGMGTGVGGETGWSWTDGRGLTWMVVKFDDPFLGSNSGGVQVWMMGTIQPVPRVIGIDELHVPVPSDRYGVVATIGSGNKCEMRYDLAAR